MTLDATRWLAADTPEALAWQVAQNAAAAERLGAWPGRAALHAHITELVSAAPALPRPGGERWFTVEGEPATLHVADEPSSRSHAITAFPEHTVDWLFPSPDG